jgi:hypothetical protein
MPLDQRPSCLHSSNLPLYTKQRIQSLRGLTTDCDRASTGRQLSPVRERLRDQEHVLLEGTQLVPELAPRIEVSSRVNGTANSANLLLSFAPHGEVLSKCSRSLNRWLIHTLRGVEGVVAAVRREVPAQGPGLSRSKHVPGFNDVVFDERVTGPAVEGEVTGALRVVCALVLHGPVVHLY